MNKYQIWKGSPKGANLKLVSLYQLFYFTEMYNYKLNFINVILNYLKILFNYLIVKCYNVIVTFNI